MFNLFHFYFMENWAHIKSTNLMNKYCEKIYV